MHGSILIYGLAVAAALHVSAHSRDERLQYAAKSWKDQSERNSTLEVDCATQLDASLPLIDSDIRYRNQIVELTPAGFAKLQLAHPCLLHDR